MWLEKDSGAILDLMVNQYFAMNRMGTTIWARRFVRLLDFGISMADNSFVAWDKSVNFLFNYYNIFTIR